MTRLRRGAARVPPCPQLPARGRGRHGHWRTRRYGARVQPVVLVVSTINDHLGDSLVGSRGTHPLSRPNPARVTKVVRAGGGWWDPGRPVRAASYGMIWPVVAPDPALASVTGAAAGACAVPCGWRLAAATVTAASSATPACSRLIARPLTSQRPSGCCSATAMHGPPGSRCAVSRLPSPDGLIMTPA
jgi:hypothetical protein